MRFIVPHTDCCFNVLIVVPGATGRNQYVARTGDACTWCTAAVRRLYQVCSTRYVRFTKEQKHEKTKKKNSTQPPTPPRTADSSSSSSSSSDFWALEKFELQPGAHSAMKPSARGRAAPGPVACRARTRQRQQPLCDIGEAKVVGSLLTVVKYIKNDVYVLLVYVPVRE